MSKTISEELFEAYCAARGIACVRIPERETRTPDYDLVCGTQRVVVEVKEITPNKAEKESDLLLEQRGYGSVLSHTPGGRLRQKILSCSGQIKGRTLGILPSILIVFDRGRMSGHVDPYNVRVAMYGLEQVYVAVPPLGAGSPYATGMGYGPKQQMTPNHNTSISAIGALGMTGAKEIHLSVYHNRFANVPLDPRVLGKYGIDQFDLRDIAPGTTAKWHEIEVTR